ncbi:PLASMODESMATA CALLOSE-BINDING PROTEIN 4 [Carica papaya]|uniref:PLASMODESMATA CALLOSE-BINDING PROTEIN 4 n=1 Tax=Carica papaya TaxID=3649 RepID=UPI000B8CE545|nr:PLASMODESMATA CALLOSE-BINDING PROTEIN 4 [Carica papaya]
MFPSSRRQMLSRFKTSLRDAIDPPTTPISTTPVTLPTNNPTPTIVTVPSTNPVTITPANPDSNIPSTTPVTIPPLVPITNPVTTPAPVTVPGAQPITNPVTTYPVPTGNVPATTNAPAIPGQSWCVAKIGSSETALQLALDYACGIGGADCSQIQQGGSCYNPNTVQNHASFAFNSYYQKNPVASSCDFGGTANVISTNPSTGSCIYSSFSSSPSPTTNTVSPTTPAATPITTIPPASTGTGLPSSGTPSTVLNSSNPASGTAAIYGSDTPPSVNTSDSSPLKVLIASPLACLVSGIIITVMGI